MAIFENAITQNTSMLTLFCYIPFTSTENTQMKSVKINIAVQIPLCMRLLSLLEAVVSLGWI